MVLINNNRDSLLTEFGKKTLQDRYLLEGETYQGMFKRVAEAYAEDEAHAQRMYDYISQLWFMPATPILANGGTTRGLPISCFLNTVQDDMTDIADTWRENASLGAGGGGIGTYWGDVRSIGEKINQRGQTSGIIPFIKVQESMTLGVSQGGIRRGSSAVYCHISHPEIEDFIEIRRPTGDPRKKSPEIHHGVCIDDAFMEAVVTGKMYGLKSPKTGEVLKEVNARELWQQLLITRLETGEPYIMFTDTVNRSLPEHHKYLGLKVKQSNLCSEILLPTSKERTAVCCLGSFNLELWDSWKDNYKIVEDCALFLDNVLTSFCKSVDKNPAYKKAVKSVMGERSIGLGQMGFHYLLQSKSIPFDSALAKSYAIKISKELRERCKTANTSIGIRKANCGDYLNYKIRFKYGHKLLEKRFSYMQAIAPTASISIIAGSTSPSIEPLSANMFIHKTLSGTFEVKNKYLEIELEKLGINNDETWMEIIDNRGSVQNLNIPQELKDVFKTAYEIDNDWIIEHAAARAPYIDQGQSINLFLPPKIDKGKLLSLHMKAWKTGVKTLYYCRSQSEGKHKDVSTDNEKSVQPENLKDYDECLACQ